MNTLKLNSVSEQATGLIGADIAMVLKPGDLVGLSGGLGVGKTVLARAIIRHLAGNPDFEVPSPSYTLCQHYETTPPISHFDLYRISDAAELDELGFWEALEEGCILVEWPEKALDPFPAEALLITLLDEEDDKRTLTISGSGELFERVSHSLKIREFLVENKFSDAVRARFSADASARNYEHVTCNRKSMYLMDVPAAPDGAPVKDGKPYSQIAHLAEDVSPFVAVGNALREHGFIAPEIYASNLDDGLLLLEDLGSTGVLDESRRPLEPRYMAAVEMLASLHECDWHPELKIEPGRFHQVPKFDVGAMLAEVSLLIDWYVSATSNSELATDKAREFFAIWTQYAECLQTHEQTLVLRDFHSPNILWREEAPGTDRIGLIDYQDALIGPSAYDVASLAQDGRVDVEPALENRLVDHYISIRKSTRPGFDADRFREAYALMAAQRATKLLGIFVRLNERDGKQEYLAHLPRVRGYMKRNLEHPALAGYKAWLEAVTDL